MKRSVDLKWSNLKTGVVLILAIAIALWASLNGPGISIFESKDDFVAYFPDVNGLVKGSPVWVSGVEVGNVRSVDFVNLDSLRRILVVGSIAQSVWPMITEGTFVRLGTIGILGDKYVDVIPGPKDGRRLNVSDTLPAEQAHDAASMFQAGKEALGEAKHLATNLDMVLERMNRGEGTLGQLATNDALYIQMTKLSTQLATLVGDLQKNQERIVGSIEKTANSVEQLSNQVNSNTGTIGKLMNDAELYNNLSATSARLDTIMNKINTAEGTAGLLVNDTALYVEVVNLLSRVNNLVTDIEKNPRKYFKLSVF
jgi:phospholipid/cholesterol/gamma-HCH transport system substrate-binding protein